MAHNVYSRHAPAIFHVVPVGRRIHVALAAHLDGVGDPGLVWEAAVVSYKGCVKSETLDARAVHCTDSSAEHAIARTANCQVVPRREGDPGPAHQYRSARGRVPVMKVPANTDSVDAVDDVELSSPKEFVVSRNPAAVRRRRQGTDPGPTRCCSSLPSRSRRSRLPRFARLQGEQRERHTACECGEAARPARRDAVSTLSLYRNDSAVARPRVPRTRSRGCATRSGPVRGGLDVAVIDQRVALGVGRVGPSRPAPYI
jgi:hypothetical protein